MVLNQNCVDQETNDLMNKISDGLKIEYLDTILAFWIITIALDTHVTHILRVLFDKIISKICNYSSSRQKVTDLSQSNDTS